MIWEYTLTTTIAAIIVICLDLFWLKTKLLTRRRYWLFLLIVTLLQTIVDNYLNGRWLAGDPIVGPYGNQFYSQIRIWHTPIENYLYGWTLITLVVSIYEYLRGRPAA